VNPTSRTSQTDSAAAFPNPLWSRAVTTAPPRPRRRPGRPRRRADHVVPRRERGVDLVQQEGPGHDRVGDRVPGVVRKHQVLQRTVPGEGHAAQRGLPGLDPDQSLQHDVVFPAGAQVVGIGELAHPGGEQAAQPSAVLAVGRLQRVEGVGEPAPADLEDLQVVPPHRNSTAIVQASVPHDRGQGRTDPALRRTPTIGSPRRRRPRPGWRSTPLPTPAPSRPPPNTRHTSTSARTNSSPTYTPACRTVRNTIHASSPPCFASTRSRSAGTTPRGH